MDGRYSYGGIQSYQRNLYLQTIPRRPLSSGRLGLRIRVRISFGVRDMIRIGLGLMVRVSKLLGSYLGRVSLGLY